MDENGRVPVVVQLIQRTYDRQDDMADMRCDFFKVDKYVILTKSRVPIHEKVIKQNQLPSYFKLEFCLS
jgi:hypothetical protein